MFLQQLFVKPFRIILQIIKSASSGFERGVKQAITAVIILVTLNLACRTATQIFLPATPLRPSPTTPHSPIQKSPSPSIQPSKTSMPHPSSTPYTTPTQLHMSVSCEGILAFRIIDPPEQVRDLFEHHAQGTFLILHLEVMNLTQSPIQIYADDYTLILPDENVERLVKPHMAATNYLYIIKGGNFYQDKIKPATIWHTYLAFDVPTQTKQWQLLLKPGSGNSPPICQTTLSP